MGVTNPNDPGWSNQEHYIQSYTIIKHDPKSVWRSKERIIRSALAPWHANLYAGRSKSIIKWTIAEPSKFKWFSNKTSKWRNLWRIPKKTSKFWRILEDTMFLKQKTTNPWSFHRGFETKRPSSPSPDKERSQGRSTCQSRAHVNVQTYILYIIMIIYIYTIINIYNYIYLYIYIHIDMMGR